MKINEEKVLNSFITIRLEEGWNKELNGFELLVAKGELFHEEYLNRRNLYPSKVTLCNLVGISIINDYKLKCENPDSRSIYALSYILYYSLLNWSVKNYFEYNFMNIISLPEETSLLLNRFNTINRFKYLTKLKYHGK